MKRTFLDFVNERNERINNKKIINEAFSEKNIEKAIEMIETLFVKNIPGIMPLPGFVNTVIGDDECMSKQYMVISKDNPHDASMFQLNWLNSEGSISIYSIDFFKNMNIYWRGEDKADVSVYTLGSSIVHFLPLIYDIVNNKKYSVSQDDAEKIISTVGKDVVESLYNIEENEYIIYENLSCNIIKEAFSFEAKKTDEANKLEQELSGKSKPKGKVKVAIEKNKPVKVKQSEELEKKEEKISKKHKDPEEIFKEMSLYVKLITNGSQPALIICGAPGVGKTYKVMKQLEADGFDDAKGNLYIIKGKCTTRQLYTALYKYRKEGNIILVDDADSIVGPNADENSINILKAAFDSTSNEKGRLVVYDIAGKLTDNEGNEIPKRFYCKCGIIVITNYHTGSLDTAFRGRSFVQDIDLTNEDALKLIHNELKSIEPKILGLRSKMYAYKYLTKLNEDGSPLELSFRTFVLCAKIYQSAFDLGWDIKTAESMIAHQMENQYSRAPKNSKY